jgi:hypothetical protein
MLNFVWKLRALRTCFFATCLWTTPANATGAAYNDLKEVTKSLAKRDTAVARKADDPFAKIAHFDQTKVYLIVDEAVLKKITSKQMKKYLFSDGCFTREFLGRSQMAVAMNQQKDDDESQSLT